jgi:hypothetical protein
MQIEQAKVPTKPHTGRVDFVANNLQAVVSRRAVYLP